MNYRMPGLPVHHQLPDFTQAHVHWASDAIQPFHPLSSPFPPIFNLSQHQGLLKWVSSLHQVAKVLEFQLQHQSFQWIFMNNFLKDGLVGSPCSSRDSQESSLTSEFKSINSLVLLNCGVGEDSWESLGLQGDPTSPSLRKLVLKTHWKDWCWSWNSNTLTGWCEELTHWKRPWCWERLKIGGEGDDRGWDGWMASPTRWTWVWASSGIWWWTGKPGVLQYMGL